MSYRNTDAPDSAIIKLQLSIGQIKVLNGLVDAEIGDIERELVYSDKKTFKTLCNLCDVFNAHLRIPLTPEEEAAKRKPFFDACRAGNEAFKISINESRGGLEND
ncbi:MAG: hypothetical protein K2V71_01450 [Methylotenera sp.]|nr:hypothetical protein [Methylotenera sp.]